MRWSRSAFSRARPGAISALPAEIPNPGDYIATTVGETAVIVTRDGDGQINAFVNRCAHRGNLCACERHGNAKEISCIYHGWTYDLAGQFDRRRVRARGQAARRDAARIPQGRAQFAAAAGRRVRRPRFWLVPRRCAGSRNLSRAERSPAGFSRVLNRPARILGRSTQVLPNNWKLYAENVKDTYHASILHLFLTTFRINRLSQEGGIVIDDSGGASFQLFEARLRAGGCRLQSGGIALGQWLPARRTARSSSWSTNMATGSRCRS